MSPIQLIVINLKSLLLISNRVLQLYQVQVLQGHHLILPQEVEVLVLQFSLLLSLLMELVKTQDKAQMLV